MVLVFSKIAKGVLKPRSAKEFIINAMALRNVQSSIRRHGAPATVIILALAVASFLISWVSGSVAIFSLLSFDPSLFAVHPWSVVTYPFAVDPRDIIGIFFMVYWMWIIGATVEREIGVLRYVIFFLTMTAVPWLLMFACLATMGKFHPLYGLYLPVAGITVAWAVRRPNASMLFMMVFPIQAKWLAWLTAALVVFGYGFPYPVIGILMGIHLLLAYLYASNRIPGLAYGEGPPKKQQWLPREKDDRFLDAVKKREQERAERERLRKLFEGSIGDDPEDKR